MGPRPSNQALAALTTQPHPPDFLSIDRLLYAPWVPSLGRNVDRVVGSLSRLLHLRQARQNTLADLLPYLGAPLGDLLPTPTAPTDVARWRVLSPRPSRSGAAVLEHLEWKSEHIPIVASYRARHQGEYVRNQTASARWRHAPEPGRRRALIYVHGWLEPFQLRALFLPHLQRAIGVDVLDVELPFHGHRCPKGALFHGELFWTGDLVRSFEALRQSCIDVRTLVAWLRAQGYTEVGVIGASLGGAIAMTLACAPPIPDFIIPIIGHLQLADVVENAPIFWRMKADLERFGLDVGRRREIFDQFRASGPAPLVPRERQLWIMARDDQYMSAEAVVRQWREWGEPPIEWIDGGHMTLALHLPLVIALVRNFYRGLGVASP